MSVKIKVQVQSPMHSVELYSHIAVLEDTFICNS